MLKNTVLEIVESLYGTLPRDVQDWLASCELVYAKLGSDLPKNRFLSVPAVVAFNYMPEIVQETPPGREKLLLGDNLPPPKEKRSQGEQLSLF